MFASKNNNFNKISLKKFVDLLPLEFLTIPMVPPVYRTKTLLSLQLGSAKKSIDPLWPYKTWKITY